MPISRDRRRSATRRARRVAADRARIRRRRAASWALLLVVATLMWPQRLGGATTVVVVHGHSMEPTFHPGDTLVVRSGDAPQVGDVAVYRRPPGAGDVGAGAHVVHRIVGRSDDGRYRFRGDNNAQPDDARPAAADLVGRPVVNLGPLPVRALTAAPLLAAVLVALTIGWLIWPEPEPRVLRPRFDDAILAADVLEALRPA